MTSSASRSKIPYFFFAFFAVVLVVNIFYIYLSQKNYRGVVVEKSYQRGIEYNKTIEQARKQKEIGWRVQMQLQNLGAQNVVFAVQLFDKNSHLIKDANMRLYLKRPTQEGFDFEVPLIFAHGKYQGKISFPLKGQWEFNLEISRGEDVFYETKRYVIE